MHVNCGHFAVHVKGPRSAPNGAGRAAELDELSWRTAIVCQPRPLRRHAEAYPSAKFEIGDASFGRESLAAEPGCCRAAALNDCPRHLRARAQPPVVRVPRQALEARRSHQDRMGHGEKSSDKAVTRLVKQAMRDAGLRGHLLHERAFGHISVRHDGSRRRDPSGSQSWSSSSPKIQVGDAMNLTARSGKNVRNVRRAPFVSTADFLA
jgi:hypothetical protein